MKKFKVTAILMFFALMVMVAQPYVIIGGKVITAPGTDIVSSASAVYVTGVTLSKTTAAIKVGASVSLTANVLPSGATNKAVTWSSSNSAVASVSGGKVVGKSKGTAKITVKTTDGAKTASCTVTVSTVAVTGVKLSKASATILKGKTLKLSATILPSNATNKKVTWKSSSTGIATVNGTGTVTGKGKGVATISVTTVDGKKVAKCKITVK
ncbi:MAG: Ig-like domain-containing protein [Bacillota bacterium]